VDWIQSKGGEKYIIEGLKTSKKDGISTDSVAKRTAAFGTNSVESRPPKTFCEIVWE
jgi:hypothetical protein